MSNVIAAEIGLQQHLADCFHPLPGEITPDDCSTPDSLRDGFARVLLSSAAEKNEGVVFAWIVERPYRITVTAQSRVSYIEKTDETIAQRWRRYIGVLANDGCTSPSNPGEFDLRQWARESSNWSYYSQLIERHGPMQVWWASAALLNEAAGGGEYRPVQWEAHMLRCFHAKHGCLPAKNRRHSGPLLDL